jgi:hypothetical protein
VLAAAGLLVALRAESAPGVPDPDADPFLQDTTAVLSPETAWARYYVEGGYFQDQPWMARALQADIGLPESIVAVIFRANEVLLSKGNAEGAAGAIGHRLAVASRAPTPQERAELDSLALEDTALSRSLDSVTDVLVQLLPPETEMRISHWMREQSLLCEAAGSKIEPMFGESVTFGAAYHAAPDSLESAWRLLRSSPAVQAVVARRVRLAMATLPGRERLSAEKSAQAERALATFSLAVLRLRTELSVVNYTFMRWPGGRGIENSEDMFAAYTQDLVRRVRSLRMDLLNKVAPLVGLSSTRLEEKWSP